MEISGEKGDVVEVAKGVLETILHLVGVSASVTPQATPAASVNLEIKGEDLGILIGRRGQTLASLQYIVRLIVTRQTKAWTPIIIDVEGYKRRRYEALQALAWRIAEQVKSKGVPFALEPMPAFDRRIIHLALADHPNVTTQSSGEGEARKVVILPKEQST